MACRDILNNVIEDYKEYSPDEFGALEEGIAISIFEITVSHFPENVNISLGGFF